MPNIRNKAEANLREVYGTRMLKVSNVNIRYLAVIVSTYIAQFFFRLHGNWKEEQRAQLRTYST